MAQQTRERQRYKQPLDEEIPGKVHQLILKVYPVIYKSANHNISEPGYRWVFNNFSYTLPPTFRSLNTNPLSCFCAFTYVTPVQTTFFVAWAIPHVHSKASWERVWCLDSGLKPTYHLLHVEVIDKLLNLSLPSFFICSMGITSVPSSRVC